MKKQIDIRIQPERLHDADYLLATVRKKLRLKPHRKVQPVIVRRSIDARKSPVVYVLKVEAYIDEQPPRVPRLVDAYPSVRDAPTVYIIGAGPAGYFAALKLIQHGIRPIILERGKDVRARRRDLRAIQQFDEVNPNSNYCFGEGGAGTYSDGKLYTRSHKRGNIQEILQLLVEHGAQEDILIDAHPHIGSNKLPKIITAIRETIEDRGGQVLFDHLVTDFILDGDQLVGLQVNGDQVIDTTHVILATGHSARDIFYLLHDLDIEIEAKPFALGIRIEHPQSLIDQIQYKQSPRSEHLPASAYSLVTQVEDQGVFSFCMCPGGLVVPAATAPGELVVNGMSLSRRDSAFANSGIVTSIDPADLEDYQEDGVLAALHFQEDVEHMMFDHDNGSQKAPAQRMTDFVRGVASPDLADTSYIPGLRSEPLHEMLPPFIYDRLKVAMLHFGKKLKGYLTSEANVIGVESRTSSPIRIPRDPQTRAHIRIRGLYPCGEGAGYAGGIVSAALDGQNVAKAIADHR